MMGRETGRQGRSRPVTYNEKGYSSQTGLSIRKAGSFSCFCWKFAAFAAFSAGEQKRKTLQENRREIAISFLFTKHGEGAWGRFLFSVGKAQVQLEKETKTEVAGTK